MRDRLNAVFGNDRVIGLGHDMEWPPRSPDLTPCDFFLWGYLKGKVFSSPPHDVNILRQRVIAEFNALRNNPNFIILLMQCAICKSEPHFVLREMEDTLKDTALE